MVNFSGRGFFYSTHDPDSEHVQRVQRYEVMLEQGDM